jgi:hypothetical protein
MRGSNPLRAFMSTQQFNLDDIPENCFTVRKGTDGYYALCGSGGQQGPFDTNEEALQAAIDACAKLIKGEE